MASPINVPTQPGVRRQIPPSMLRTEGFVLQALRTYWGDAGQIEDPALSGFVWTEDTAKEITSKIRIITLDEFKPRSADMLPSLVVVSQDAQSEPQGVAGRVQGNTLLNPAAAMHNQPRLGDIQKVATIAGTITIYCSAELRATAARLGEEVYNYMLALSQFATTLANVQHFWPSVLGGPQKLEELPDGWTVPVQIAISYTRELRLTTNSPLLKRLNVICQ